MRYSSGGRAVVFDTITYPSALFEKQTFESFTFETDPKEQMLIKCKYCKETSFPSSLKCFHFKGEFICRLCCMRINYVRERDLTSRKSKKSMYEVWGLPWRSMMKICDNCPSIKEARELPMCGDKNTRLDTEPKDGEIHGTANNG